MTGILVGALIYIRPLKDSPETHSVELWEADSGGFVARLIPPGDASDFFFDTRAAAERAMDALCGPVEPPVSNWGRK